MKGALKFLKLRGKGKKKKKKSKDMEMMKKLGDRHHRLLHLPEDIIVFKILVRLPVVEVIRCTSVCKQWYALIKTPLFISTHLSISSSSSSSRSSQPAVLVDDCISRRLFMSSHFEPQSFQDDCRTIPLPFPLPHHAVVLGPIHGLFFLFVYCASSPVYCLWNPSVRRYIPLPSPTFSSDDNWRAAITFGFAFDAKSEDFKVLACKDVRLSETPNYQLFSMKQGSWRTLVANEAAKYCGAIGHGLFGNGALHWMARKRRKEDYFHHFVLTFDIALETFKEMELPQELLPGSYKYSFFETKGSLACYGRDYVCPIEEFLHINRYSIWVMKENGAANSWVKMWTFELTADLGRIYGFWGNGDEILVKKGWFGKGGLILYDTKTHGFRDFAFDVKAYIYGIYVYTESLILLDKESEAISY